MNAIRSRLGLRSVLERGRLTHAQGPGVISWRGAILSRESIGILLVIILAGTLSGRVQGKEYPALPQGLTSFGAAIVGDWLYVYGGHFGRAHHYDKNSQSDKLLRLNLREPTQWQTVAQGPRLQGLALVSFDDTLYRVGGFTAHNEEDEEHDLRSVADFARFDPTTKQWQALPRLPEPRSSHDAVMVKNRLYVVGGWHMGPEGTQWHQTAWAIDLSQKPLKWTRLPDPPFQRRALSLAHHEGKIFVIGGMQKQGSPTTRVDCFDPQTGLWTQVQDLVDPLAKAERGRGMEGFGTSAFTVAGEIFVSTFGGNLQRLDGQGTWQIATKLRDDRFFHRMLPYQGRLLLIGGASMQTGKHLEIEQVSLDDLK